MNKDTLKKELKNMSNQDLLDLYLDVNDEIIDRMMYMVKEYFKEYSENESN